MKYSTNLAFGLVLGLKSLQLTLNHAQSLALTALFATKAPREKLSITRHARRMCLSARHHTHADAVEACD
jgi:hypothetical protein